MFLIKKTQNGQNKYLKPAKPI